MIVANPCSSVVAAVWFTFCCGVVPDRIDRALPVIDAAPFSAGIMPMMSSACEPDWVPGFGDPRLNGGITSLLVHDFGDGNGPGVYAAGLFTNSDDGPLHRIARWDGLRRHPLGSGMNDSVSALAVLQTQEQEVLVAGGISMIVFDDGQGLGPALYVGGAFAQAGALASKQIARWQGCPSSPPCPTDLNGDSATDIADLLLILAAWGSCDGCIEDLTGDDVVDPNDLLAILAGWGPCS